MEYFDKALEYYDKAISIDSQYAEAYNCKGILLEDMGRMDDAKYSYNQAIELDINYGDEDFGRSIGVNKEKLL